jgi:L-ascorbate metabolism protein UlaG (beta-lactamase superfamily)
MNKYIFYLLALSLMLSCKNNTSEDVVAKIEAASNNLQESVPASDLKVDPIAHATIVLSWEGTTLYVDPVGGISAFEGYHSPDIILVTDIHGDHLNLETLEAIVQPNTKLLVPHAVAEKLSEKLAANVTIIQNGEIKDLLGFNIEAIPMYNLREEALQFHVKGRGNGYVIEKNGERVYISGDTEDIPEMRSLQNIDKAFVCMNLPYTMTVESAADAVINFAPKEVYPYHYRGTEGLSDVVKFQQLVNHQNTNIKVIQLNWYPPSE